MNKMGPEAWIHGTGWQFSEGMEVGGTGRDQLKNTYAYMDSPWTQTMWGWVERG